MIRLSRQRAAESAGMVRLRRAFTPPSPRSGVTAVPVVILMVLAIGLNALIIWLEHRIAPWQAEIAGRDRE